MRPIHSVNPTDRAGRWDLSYFFYVTNQQNQEPWFLTCGSSSPVSSLTQQTHHLQPITMRIASSLLNLFCLLQIGALAFHSHRATLKTCKPSQLCALSEDKHVETILFVECGFGADAHGQDCTKAAGERTTPSSRPPTRLRRTLLLTQPIFLFLGSPRV